MPARASDGSADDGLDALRADVERLRRLTRESMMHQHDDREKVRALEARARRDDDARATRTTVDREVTFAWTSEPRGGGTSGGARSLNVRKESMSSDAAEGAEARATTTTTFDDGVVPGKGVLECVMSSSRSEFLDQNDAFESRVVTLDRVMFSNALARRRTTIRGRFAPLGAEGRDAIPGGTGGGGGRRSHRLTGFGARGMNLIERSHSDVMGAVSIERDGAFAVHAGVFTGNRQPEDNLGKLLVQASAKSSTSTRHVNAALNLSRCQSGETVLGAAVTFAKTLKKTTRAVVGDVWAQRAVSQPDGREDLTEWGVAATLPPITGAGAIKNAGWGFVIGKPANRGGVQAEAYLRLGSDGIDPGATVLPGVIVTQDDRGSRETTFACRGGWNW